MGKVQTTIVSAPPSGGTFTEGIRSISKKVDRIYASVRETGASTLFTATVTLQFLVAGDTDWQDYETYTEAARKIIEDAGEVRWRIGVKEGDYTEGEVTVGIDWK